MNTHTHVWPGLEESKKGKDPGKSKSMIVAASWRIIIIATGLGNLIQQKGMDHSLSLSPLSIGLQGIWYTVKAGQKLTKGHHWSGYCMWDHPQPNTLLGKSILGFCVFLFFFPLNNISLHLIAIFFYYYYNHCNQPNIFFLNV